MATTFKALCIANELADRMKVRPALNTLGVGQATDTDLNPIITIGVVDLTATPVAATTVAAALVKVEPLAWPLAQDILGNTALQYTPHVIRILKEAGPAGTPTGGGLSSSAVLELLAQCAGMGCRVEIYETTSGSGVVLADIDAATKLVDAYDPSAYYPVISSQ